MKLSVIVPVYNEVCTIEEIIKRVKKAALDLDKEIIIVDDGSTDGTRELIDKIESEDIKKLFHEKNQGKGAAVRTALEYVTGDIVLIQDADLEYHPDDYLNLIKPIIRNEADVVFGSRFIGSHRCFLFTHYLGNKIINLVASILYNTILTDFMTGYKVFKTEVIKDIPIRSNGFGFEAEVTGIVFRKSMNVYEVPIAYSGRDYRAGKKIKCWDFFIIIWSLVRSRVGPFKDITCDTLSKLSYVNNYNSYIYEKIKPYLGRRVIEIGAGSGNITRFLVNNRELVVAIDNSREHLFYLSRQIPESSIFKNYFYDIEEEPPQVLKGFSFDTAVCINVLEHINSQNKALGNIAQLLNEGGRLILVIPAHKWLFSDFDKKVNHLRRYDKRYIQALLEDSGYYLEKIGYLNILGIIGWYFNFKILKKNGFSSCQLFIFNHIVWMVKILDRIFKKTGLSLVAVAVKK